jgi:hypothetical protein
LDVDPASNSKVSKLHRHFKLQTRRTLKKTPESNNNRADKPYQSKTPTDPVPPRGGTEPRPDVRTSAWGLRLKVLTSPPKLNRGEGVVVDTVISTICTEPRNRDIGFAAAQFNNFATARLVACLPT